MMSFFLWEREFQFAANVGQVFGVSIGNAITAITSVPNLFALEIDPEAAAQGYRDRIVGPVRGVLPDAKRYALVPLLSVEPVGQKNSRALSDSPEQIEKEDFA